MTTERKIPVCSSNSRIKGYACLAGFMATACATEAHALEWRIQPRLSTGFMHYSLDYDPIVSTSGNDSSVDRFSLSDDMPSISGGVTLFLDRFFIDLTAQHAFNGSATSNVNAVITRQVPQLGETRLRPTVRFDSDIERIEYAFTAGFQITQSFNVYAGYRNTETSLDQRLTGTLASSNPLFNGPLSGNGDFVFDYSGPFVGTTYTWDFSDWSLPGALTGNLGLAFLDASNRFTTSNIRFRGVLQPKTSGFSSTLGALRPDLQGDAVGLSIGLSWRGRTAISGLSYSAGVSGYRYEFENSQTGGANFDETLIRLDVGVAYAFQL